MFWAFRRAHFMPRLEAWAKMSRAQLNMFMPENTNLIIVFLLFINLMSLIKYNEDNSL